MTPDTPERRQKKEKALKSIERTKGDVQAASFLCGIKKSTITTWMRTDPEFAQKIQAIREAYPHLNRLHKKKKSQDPKVPQFCHTHFYRMFQPLEGVLVDDLYHFFYNPNDTKQYKENFYILCRICNIFNVDQYNIFKSEDGGGSYLYIQRIIRSFSQEEKAKLNKKAKQLMTKIQQTPIMDDTKKGIKFKKIKQ